MNHAGWLGKSGDSVSDLCTNQELARLGDERLVRPHTQLFKQNANQDKHNHESYRCNRCDCDLQQILENSSRHSPVMGYLGVCDNTLTKVFYPRWYCALAEPKEQRGKERKDYSEA